MVLPNIRNETTTQAIPEPIPEPQPEPEPEQEYTERNIFYQLNIGEVTEVITRGREKIVSRQI